MGDRPDRSDPTARHLYPIMLLASSRSRSNPEVEPFARRDHRRVVRRLQRHVVRLHVTLERLRERLGGLLEFVQGDESHGHTGHDGDDVVAADGDHLVRRVGGALASE